MVFELMQYVGQALTLIRFDPKGCVVYFRPTSRGTLLRNIRGETIEVTADWKKIGRILSTYA